MTTIGFRLADGRRLFVSPADIEAVEAHGPSGAAIRVRKRIWVIAEPVSAVLARLKEADANAGTTIA